jgi:nucleoid DNA-binding protein
MDILSYLTTLIKTHKEVGIPGLGTIYKRKSPGRYDVNTHSFLPPSYSLSFTSDLKEQTLLTELISRKKNISTDSAHYFVEQFAQNILDELSGHQESDFGDLGTFSTTSGSLTFIPKQDSNLGFDFYGLPALKTEPDTDKVEISEEQPIQEDETPVETGVQEVTEEQLELENNNADLSDGAEEEAGEELNQPAENEALISHLDSTELPVAEQENQHDEQPVYEEIAEVTTEPETQQPQSVPVIETQENVEERMETPVDPGPVIPQPVQEVDLPSPVKEETVHFTLDYTDKEKSGFPAYLKIIIGLVVLAILIGIIYLAKPELFDGILKKSANQPAAFKDPTQQIKNAEQLKIDSIVRADSIRRLNEKAILAADSAKDSVAAKKVAPAAIAIPIAVDAEVTYEIIAASLLNQKEANNFLADMKKKGIPAKVADMPGRRVKISIGSFTDEETAKKELEVLKKTTKIPGIYIYKVRHTNNSK